MSLVISGSTGKKFTPHPIHSGPVTCIDVVDLGWMENKVYDKWEYKIRLVFWAGLWTEEKELDGEKMKFPMLVMQRFTASLADKARLRDFCRTWRGEDFSPEVLRDGFDFEAMVGAPGYGQITHNVSGENTYANISVIKLAAGMGDAPGIPEGYERVKDREGWEGPIPHPAMEEPRNDEPDFDMAPDTEHDISSPLPF